MAARMAGPFDDRLDAFFERLVVDAPARRGEHPERTEYGLVHQALRIAGTSNGVVTRLALAHPVHSRDEVARRKIERSRLRLDELLSERLLVCRAHRRGRGGSHYQRRVGLARRPEGLA